MLMATETASDSYLDWEHITDAQLTVDHVDNLLAHLEDDLWVCAACFDRVVENVDVQRALLELGIRRSDSAVQRIRALTLDLQNGPNDDEVSQSEENEESALVAYLSADVQDAKLCQMRVELLNRLDRLNTYNEVLEKTVTSKNDHEKVPSQEEWEDDPWADTDEEPTNEVAQSLQPSHIVYPPMPLSIFITTEIYFLCLSLASEMQFDALTIVAKRHWQEIFPFRISVLNQFPAFLDPIAYHELLPGVDVQTGKELCFPNSPWRVSPDYTESEEVMTTLAALGFSATSLFSEIPQQSSSSSHPDLLSSSDIGTWYKERTNSIIQTTGMIDVALSLVQEGASRGVAELDELGEDLTLIARLVYDAIGLNAPEVTPITMLEWASLTPHDTIQRYLSYSTPTTIVADIRSLVLPYLFVLESRCERAGKPDPDLTARLLYEYILSSSLSTVVPVFEASKPTLVASQRLITSNEDLARLALACLYGTDRTDQWTDMSQIFECLPAWNFDLTEDGDEMDTTVDTLKTLLTPSASRPHCSPSDLLLFFKELPPKSLSRALDVLDVHLESGEILSRWGVSVPLRWFFQTANDSEHQRAMAVKLARQGDAPSGDLDSEDVWVSLLEDMIKLTQPPDNGVIPVFGAITEDDIRQIFFRGLLSTGRFAIAKKLIDSRHSKRLLDSNIIQTLCLECSREFYDNANSGNYNFGDMKLAYDCLSVAPSSTSIEREREFIEATSRISTFNLMSRPGVPILPIEIRLTKDKLSLVSRVLSSNETAYKHTEVILELMRKLGFRDDVVAEVRTLAMIADSALQAEDFTRAFEISERMVQTVQTYRQVSHFAADNPKVAEVVEICWVACYQLGRQAEAGDIDKKLDLLGRALELCPADKITDILVSWRKVESEDTERWKGAKKSKSVGTKMQNGRVWDRSSTLASRLPNLHMPSPSLPSAPDAAAMASQAFSRVAASFPFSIHSRPAEGNRSHSREGSGERAGSPDVQSQARHALQRGIGWLIGAEEDELP